MSTTTTARTTIRAMVSGAASRDGESILTARKPKRRTTTKPEPQHQQHQQQAVSFVSFSAGSSSESRKAVRVQAAKASAAARKATIARKLAAQRCGEGVAERDGQSVAGREGESVMERREASLQEGNVTGQTGRRIEEDERVFRQEKAGMSAPERPLLPGMHTQPRPRKRKRYAGDPTQTQSTSGWVEEVEESRDLQYVMAGISHGRGDPYESTLQHIIPAPSTNQNFPSPYDHIARRHPRSSLHDARAHDHHCRTPPGQQCSCWRPGGLPSPFSETHNANCYTSSAELFAATVPRPSFLDHELPLTPASMPRMGASLTRPDPFNSYPIEHNPIYDRLLHHMMTVFAPRGWPALKITYAQGVDWEWFMTQHALREPALFLVRLLFASGDMIRLGILDPAVSLRLQSAAVEALNEALATPSRACSDGLILAVGRIALHESMYGDRAAANAMHRPAQRRMIDLRGGITGLGFPPLITRLMRWADRVMALQGGTQRLLPDDEESSSGGEGGIVRGNLKQDVKVLEEWVPNEAIALRSRIEIRDLLD